MPIKNIVTGQKVTQEKLQRAKELRREMTPAEKLLWQEVRAKKLGVRFRRQQIIQVCFISVETVPKVGTNDQIFSTKPSGRSSCQLI